MEQEYNQDVGSSSDEVKLAISAMEAGEAAEEEHHNELKAAVEAVEEPSEDDGEEVTEEVEDTEVEDDGEEGSEEEAEEPEEKLSEGWSKVMRLHSQVQKQQAELKERERQIEARLQQAEEAAKLAQLAKTDPVAFLEQSGVSYENAYEMWTNRILGKEAPKQVPQFDPNEIEQKIAQTVQERINQYQQQQEAQRWVSDAQNVISDSKYESIRILGAEEEVTNLAVMYLQEHGQLLSPRQAADMILSEAEKRINQIASVVGKSTTKNEASSKSRKLSKASKTLKNDLDASSLPRVDEDDEPSDARSEIKRAMALLD